jgi:hypothetical protein
MDAIVDKPKPDAAAPAAPAQPKQRKMEIVIDLEVPVMAHGEMIKQIKFRRPTAKDVMSIGNAYPIHIDWTTGEVRPNPPAMGEMMVILAAVPPPTINAMDIEDFATCSFALMGFFPPGKQGMPF